LRANASAFAASISSASQSELYDYGKVCRGRVKAVIAKGSDSAR
jgi:hypothetical protein